MSTCISREGEFSEHTLDATGGHRFTCRLCWVTDEDAMLAALDAAESRLASVKALADRLHRRAVLYAGDPEDDLATGMAGAYTLAEQLLRAVLGSDAHTEQKGTGRE